MMYKPRDRDIKLMNSFKKSLLEESVEILEFSGENSYLQLYLKSLLLHHFYIVNNVAYYIEHRKDSIHNKYYLRMNYSGVREDIDAYLRIKKISNLLESE